MVSHNVYLSLRGKLQGMRNIHCFIISLSCLGSLPCWELLFLHPSPVFSIAKGKVQLQFLGKMTAEILVNGNSTAAVQNITPSCPPSPPFTPMSFSPPMLVFMLYSLLGCILTAAGRGAMLFGNYAFWKTQATCWFSFLPKSHKSVNKLFVYLLDVVKEYWLVWDRENRLFAFLFTCFLLIE